MRDEANAALFVYIGTYTKPLPFVTGKAEGIYVNRLDLAGGALQPVQTVTGVTNPSFVALDPRRRCLYAVEELPGDGSVSAFAIDPRDGTLNFLNRQSSHGAGPAHVSVGRDGRWVLVANYDSGSIAVLPVQADGSLGPASDVVAHEGHSVHPTRQEQAHAHWIGVDPGDRFVLVADLGLDKVMSYRLDAERGTLAPNDPPWTTLPPGAGPRQVAFHPSRDLAYVINELGCTISACRYDAGRGALEPFQHVATLPDGFDGANTTAAVAVAPAGRFVYGSNRGHDSIVVCAIDDASGQLSVVEHVATQGGSPRDFGIDPTGTYLLAANQDSDTIVTFRIDAASGRLTPTGHVASVMTPVCVAFGPLVT
jgi:6-phosphogluconolactonase